MFNKMKNRRGFTLIEMMVVIAIIAILVSVLVPVIQTSKNKSMGAVDAANVRTMAAEVATKKVSESDETKLLEDLTIVDSKIKEGSTVVFYVVNENEIRAFYCNSLLFVNQLRGVIYNSAVATTGDLDSPYDTFAEGEVYRLLGAVTSSGTTVTGEDLENAINTELGNLTGDAVTGYLSGYGITVDEDGNLVIPDGAIDAILEDITDAGTNALTGGLFGDTELYGQLKVAMIESLMETYGYDAATAAAMIEGGGVANSFASGVNTGNTAVDEGIKAALTGATKNFAAPQYAISSYCGCTSKEVTSGSGCNETTETVWTCYAKDGFENYCTTYGLTPYYDHTHNP